MPNHGPGILLKLAQKNLIGGPSAAARNVISANTGDGIRVIDHSGGFVFATAGNAIQNNFIGTTASGRASLGNGRSGILLQGRTVEILSNIISANHLNGIQVSSINGENEFIHNNIIGTDPTGRIDLGNGQNGIQVGGPLSTDNGAAAQIGTDISAEDPAPNTIAFNRAAGVRVFSGTALDPNHVTTLRIFNNAQIVFNRIYSNHRLGIDLGPAGVTPNDLHDADHGPNNLQNFPVITSARQNNARLLTIKAVLDSAPNSHFAVQLYSNTSADPSGFGQGQTHLGDVFVDTNSAGHAQFTKTFNNQSLIGRFITALADDATAIGSNTFFGFSTSEFSRAVKVTA